MPVRRRSPCRPAAPLVAFAAALLAPSLAIARAGRTPDPLLPLARLLAPPTNQAPQVSPDGRWVSFMRPVNGAVNLFVAPAESPSAARALTHRTGRGLQVFDVSGNVFSRSAGRPTAAASCFRWITTATRSGTSTRLTWRAAKKRRSPTCPA